MTGGIPVQDEFDRLMRCVRACTICRDAPRYGHALAHDPRPVLQAHPSARICIISQAPGARAHASGRPYTDPSGVRIRNWLGLDEEAFYDARNVAIVGMGLCFPGNDAKGGDLPPRRECAETWHSRILAQLPDIELMLLVGQYAQRTHLDRHFTRDGVTGTVRQWRRIYEAANTPRVMPLPHPSWRNSGWLDRHLWFEAELLPVLRADIGGLLRQEPLTLGRATFRSPGPF